MIILGIGFSEIDGVIVGAVLAVALLVLWASISDYLQSGPQRDGNGRFTKSRTAQIYPLIRIAILGLVIYYGFKLFFG